MDKIYQLKIALADSNPEIWRRVLISADTTLFELHHIIQIAMGWTNYHLYEFDFRSDKNKRHYNEAEQFDGEELEGTDITLADFGLRSRSKFVYLYDFGDSWKHIITIEKISEPEPKIKLPFCLDGEQNNPPEDCGGIYTYNDMVNIITSDDHPEKGELMEWLGNNFDPAIFDKLIVNKQYKNFKKFISAHLEDTE